MFCQSGENPTQFPDTGGALRGGLRSSPGHQKGCWIGFASVARRDGDIRRTAISPASAAVAAGFSALSADSGFAAVTRFLPVDVSVEGYFRHLRLNAPCR